MADAFIGEVRMFSFNFAPRNWATCDGQLLPINQNQALFSLLGTTYGGNGTTNFALPDLRGRTPLHFNNTYPLGQKAGEPAHTLTVQELPTHSHSLQGTTADATANTPGGNLLAKTDSANPLYDSASLVAMDASSIGAAGGSQPHENMQPYLTINFSIAIFGIFPPRS